VGSTKCVSCKDCSLALVRSASESTNALLIIKNNGGLVILPVSVMKIVKNCEVIMGSSVNITNVVSEEWEKLLVSRILDMSCDLFS